MKLKIKTVTLRKLLIGTTVFNVILLITYGFLLVSATIIENYTIFMLSIPAYLFSNSWLLMLGLFGFEGLLLLYYWVKTRKTSREETEVGQENAEALFDIDILAEENETLHQDSSQTETESGGEALEESITNLLPENQEENTIREIFNSPQSQDETTIQAELEFDRLWEEAIDHIKGAVTKKKAGESLDVSESDLLQPENHESELSKSITEIFTEKSEPILSSNEEFSRAVIPKSKIKNKQRVGNPSIIKEQHREFYNEIALNNWIYKDNSDRERVGLYKIALDETRFREKDLSYLIEANIIHKLTIPFPSGSFTIYSLYEGEDKKIIKNYLAKFCKRNNLKLTQKSIAFVNYADLGLERKNWRFDFYINNSFVGLIWISNFLIEDKQTKTYTIAYNNRKELKALLATSQIDFSSTTKTALIITDYKRNAKVIEQHIEKQGFGQAQILALGEKNFEKKLLAELRAQVSA
ncbi:MAG: hypothetical protein ACTSSH_04035 [Candidatus Heimdallarchaeota archaeon]